MMETILTKPKGTPNPVSASDPRDEKTIMEDGFMVPRNRPNDKRILIEFAELPRLGPSTELAIASFGGVA
jgi:hypothetical protein